MDETVEPPPVGAIKDVSIDRNFTLCCYIIRCYFMSEATRRKAVCVRGDA
jgi:hypothetical protein